MEGHEDHGDLIHTMLHKGKELAEKLGISKIENHEENQQTETIKPSHSPSTPKRELTTYKVCDGDTPSSIALRHKMSLKEFQTANRLFGQNYLSPGSVVKVYCESTKTLQPLEKLTVSENVQQEELSSPKRLSNLNGLLFEPVILYDEKIQVKGTMEVNDMYIQFDAVSFERAQHVGEQRHRDKALLQAYRFRLDLGDITSCALTSRYDIEIAKKPKEQNMTDPIERMQEQNIVRILWTNEEMGYSNPHQLLVSGESGHDIMIRILESLSRANSRMERMKRAGRHRAESMESVSNGALVSGLIFRRDHSIGDDTKMEDPHEYDVVVHRAYLNGDISNREAAELRDQQDQLRRRLQAVSDADWTHVESNPNIARLQITVPTFFEEAASKIITEDHLLLSIRGALPERLRGDHWKIVFDFLNHGVALKRLYEQARGITDSLMFIETTDGEIFGAYCSEQWSEKHARRFYGTGESFLFAVRDGSLEVYPWTGSNDLIMNSSTTHVAMGAGGGFAFCIDEDLDRGTCSPCETFGIVKPLCNKSEYRVSQLELISFVSDASRYADMRRSVSPPLLSSPRSTSTRTTPGSTSPNLY